MAQSSPLKQAIEEICQEKNIPYESVIETIEAALAVAYRKDFGEKNQNIEVNFDPEDGTSRVFDVKTVVEDALYDEYLQEQKKREAAEAEGKLDAYLEAKRQEEEAKRSELGLADGEPLPDSARLDRFDPKKNLSLSEAKAAHPEIEVGGEIRTELFPPEAYGRMAAQTAKQVIIQRIREAERDTVYKEFKGREGEVITAMVQRVEGRMVLIDLGHATAIMPPHEQVQREHYRSGDRVKVLLVSVNMTPKGPEVVVSRAHAEMVQKLFTVEVPELQNGSVEIKGIAREAGLRTKIAVWSEQKNIDPVGSLVGQRGTRVQTVISELGGEKIDIIEWSDDPVKYITNALSPAKVISIKLNDEEKSAVAEVQDDQLSLAIGKAGQNVRLAAKLTGWKIDLVGENGEKPTAPTDGEVTADSDETAAVTEATAPETAEANPHEDIPSAPEAEHEPLADSTPAPDEQPPTDEEQPVEPTPEDSQS